MLSDITIDVVRRFWADRFGVTAGVTEAIAAVPNGTAISVVQLGDATIAVAPESCVDALAALPPERRVDIDALHAIAGDDTRALGVAHLAYADEGTLPPGDDAHVQPIADDDPRWSGFAAACGAGEWLEASMDHPATRRFGIVVEDELVAAAGIEDWDHAIAQVDAIVHPAHRRQGHGRRVGAAAATFAVQAGLVPQWRSSIDNLASTEVGRHLGFERVGTQATVIVSPS